MDVRDLDRIAFVTRHFKELQGLRMLVPFGMSLLFQALVPWFGRRRLALGLLGVVILLGGGLLLVRYSRRHYENLLGEVEVRGDKAFAHWWPVLVLAAAVLAYLAVTGSCTLQSVIYGSVLLGHWIRRDCRWAQSYHLLLGGLLLAVTVLAPEGSIAARRELTYGLGGACWIVAGLLDHWQLGHALGHLPPPDLDAEAAPAAESRR